MKIVQHLQRGGYDTIVSWLTVLHFEDRNALFKQCYEVRKNRGTVSYSCRLPLACSPFFRPFSACLCACLRVCVCVVLCVDVTCWMGNLYL